MFTSHSIAHVRYNIRRLWRLIDSSMERSHCNACRYISWISLSWISLYWQYIWWWWWRRWWTLVATSLTAWAGLTAPQEIEEGGHGLPVVILSVLPFRFLSLSSIAHWGVGFTWCEAAHPLSCPCSSACVHLLICPNMKTSFCLCMPLYLSLLGLFLFTFASVWGR